MKPILYSIVLLATAPIAAQSPVDAQSTQPAQKEVLLQSDRSWNGTPYTAYPPGTPELTVLKLTIAPHTVLPWHTHPMPNAGYILSGALTVQDRESGKKITLHAGQAFAETVNDVHRGVNEGDEPAIVVVTYAGTKGVSTSSPVKGERPEY